MIERCTIIQIVITGNAGDAQRERSAAAVHRGHPRRDREAAGAQQPARVRDRDPPQVQRAPPLHHRDLAQQQKGDQQPAPHLGAVGAGVGHGLRQHRLHDELHPRRSQPARAHRDQQLAHRRAPQRQVLREGQPPLHHRLRQGRGEELRQRGPLRVRAPQGAVLKAGPLQVQGDQGAGAALADHSASAHRRAGADGGRDREPEAVQGAEQPVLREQDRGDSQSEQQAVELQAGQPVQGDIAAAEPVGGHHQAHPGSDPQAVRTVPFSDAMVIRPTIASRQTYCPTIIKIKPTEMPPSLPTALLLLGLALVSDCSIAPECGPNYPRMFFNPASEGVDPLLVDLIFMFNTNASCPRSWLSLYHDQSRYRADCQEDKVQTHFKNGSVEFTTYVQRCQARFASPFPIEEFTYQLTGSADGASGIPTPSYLVEKSIDSLPLRLAVISDWGPIVNTTYKPLNSTLDFLLQKRELERASGGGSNEWRINGLFLNGDYAYDLETDNCYMYLRFLNEVARVSRFWPLIVNVGNHESMLPKSMYLLEHSFVIGRLSTQDGVYSRVQAYRFANRATLLLYDPFLEIYKEGTPQQYSAMFGAVREGLLEARHQHPDEFVFMASHYPVTCSQVDPHCRDAMLNMPGLFEYLSTPYEGRGLVDLYIGSHMHQYERIWPFVNNRFVNESSPYYRGRMASFVEAVGGVNYFIIEKDYTPEYFSSFATHNTTGMGIMTISGNTQDRPQEMKMHYKHIITPRTYEVVDEFELLGLWKEDQQERGQLTVEGQ